MTQTVSNELIVAASKESPEVEAALRKLFPEAFIDEPLTSKFLIEEINNSDSLVICARVYSEYANKGLWLDNERHTWEIVTDSERQLVLVGRRKPIF